MVGVLIVLLIVALLIGGVIWNHKNAAAAMAGVESSTSATPEQTVAAISACYCRGARASLRRLFAGVTVTQSGARSFRLETKIGDTGHIEVSTDGRTAVVEAATDELYVGSHPKTHFQKGLMGLASAMTHRLCELAGVTPSAARMKRFQTGVMARIERQLSASDGVISEPQRAELREAVDPAV